uniref:Uncharacterized protein n=1 Tax=Cacopsylla melanoneura TaxID=428564 RepID=A0A8D8SSZ8_9HEMI
MFFCFRCRDRDFAVIKRNVNHHDRVYLIKEFAELFLTAPVKRTYSVVLVETDQVIDLKSWWPRFYKKNVISEETRGRNTPKEDKKHFKISQFKQFTHSEDHPGVVVARDYIDSIVPHTYNLRNTNISPISRMPTAVAYPKDYLPINHKKMADLRKFQPYLPQEEEVQKFYKEIFSWETYNGGDNEEEDLDDED